MINKLSAPRREIINEILTQQKIVINRNSREAIEKRIEDVKSNPLADYANFIVDKVAETLNVKSEDIKSSSRKTELVEARAISVMIIAENTNFYDYSVVFVNRERTNFYHCKKQLEIYLMQPKRMRQYENLKSICSLSEYNRVNNK